MLEESLHGPVPWICGFQYKCLAGREVFSLWPAALRYPSLFHNNVLYLFSLRNAATAKPGPGGETYLNRNHIDDGKRERKKKKKHDFNNKEISLRENKNQKSPLGYFNICIGPFGPCECVFTWRDEVLQPLTPRPMISCGVCVDVFCVRVLVLLLEDVQPTQMVLVCVCTENGCKPRNSPVAMTSRAGAHTRTHAHTRRAHGAHFLSAFIHFFLFSRAAVSQKVIRNGLALEECAWCSVTSHSGQRHHCQVL